MLGNGRAASCLLVRRVHCLGLAVCARLSMHFLSGNILATATPRPDTCLHGFGCGPDLRLSVGLEAMTLPPLAASASNSPTGQAVSSRLYETCPHPDTATAWNCAPRHPCPPSSDIGRARRRLALSRRAAARIGDSNYGNLPHGWMLVLAHGPVPCFAELGGVFIADRRPMGKGRTASDEGGTALLELQSVR
jgi:hypothetical protein